MSRDPLGEDIYMLEIKPTGSRLFIFYMLNINPDRRYRNRYELCCSPQVNALSILKIFPQEFVLVLQITLFLLTIIYKCIFDITVLLFKIIA